MNENVQWQGSPILKKNQSSSRRRIKRRKTVPQIEEKGILGTIRDSIWDGFRSAGYRTCIIIHNNSRWTHPVAIYTRGFVMKTHDFNLNSGRQAKIELTLGNIYEIVIWGDLHKNEVNTIRKMRRITVENNMELKIREILAYGSILDFDPDESGTLGQVGQVADHIPVIGHLKASFHALWGDDEAAQKSAINSSLSTAVLLTGGLGGVAAAGGKMVVESLIPSTQTVEQKEKSIGENISASIASAPVLGYAYASGCALVGETELAKESFVHTTGNTVGMMAGGAIAPNLNIPGVNKMAGHFVGRKLGQKTSEHFRKKLLSEEEENYLKERGKENQIIENEMFGEEIPEYI